MKVLATLLLRVASVFSTAAFAHAALVDSLGPTHVFASHPKKVAFEGKFEAPNGSATLWADRILSGIEPNRYEYFVIRRPSDPAKHAFDIVFFHQNGRGVYVGIPTALVTSQSDTEVTFTFVLRGGGEAGAVETKRTISIKRERESDRLVGVISEASITSSIWSGRKKELGRAEFHFQSVPLPQVVIDSAMASPSANAKEG